MAMTTNLFGEGATAKRPPRTKVPDTKVPDTKVPTPRDPTARAGHDCRPSFFQSDLGVGVDFSVDAPPPKVDTRTKVGSGENARRQS